MNPSTRTRFARTKASRRKQKRQRPRPKLTPAAAPLRRAANDPDVLAAVFERNCASDDHGHRTLRCWRGRFWRWNGRCYFEVSHDEVASDVRAAIRREFDQTGAVNRFGIALQVTPYLVKSTKDALASRNQIPGIIEQPVGLGYLRDTTGLISMQNGLVHLTAKPSVGSRQPIRDHTPEWFGMVTLPYKYDRKAECTHFLKFLHWMFSDDKELIALVQEWFGYCLTPDTSLQKFLILQGGGANGKGVLLRVLTELLGEANVCALGPEAFRQRFGLVAVIGKLASICADVDVTEMDEGRLKALTGEDRITTDVKHKSHATFKSTAKLIFATNNPPRFNDTTEGIWRRLEIIPCDATIEEEDREPQLAERLVLELPGILNWAIEGLDRLQMQKRFTRSTAAQRCARELRTAGDPIREFLTEEVVLDPSASILTSALQEEMQNWEMANDKKASSGEALGRTILSVYGGKVKRAHTSGVPRYWEYRGIRLRNPRPDVQKPTVVTTVPSAVRAIQRYNQADFDDLEKAMSKAAS